MKRSLKDVLELNPDSIQSSDQEDDSVEDNLEETELFNDSNKADVSNHSEQGSGATIICIECGDQPAEKSCLQCEEDFCRTCFGFIHRTGKRKAHNTTEIVVSSEGNDEIMRDHDNELQDGLLTPASSDISLGDQKEILEHSSVLSSVSSSPTVQSGNLKALAALKDHARYVPLRLTQQERKLLRLLEAALQVSEYTDKVDIVSYSSRSRRVIAQLQEMCSILAGLVVASDMKQGQKLLDEKSFADNSEWFKTVFELGRRYKIMNPSKMRDTYGKLMYMVMDSRDPDIQDAMEFDLYKPIVTVYSYLESSGSEKALAMLDDPLIVTATKEIIPDGKSRHIIQRDIRDKESAVKILSNRYSDRHISSDQICQVLYSLADFAGYIRANRQPVMKMLQYLETYFDDSKSTFSKYTLDICNGIQGSRLTHQHHKQYHYVKQSLLLWSEIMRNIIKLWYLADQDLLSRDVKSSFLPTGQGRNRIKPCPLVNRTMHNIVAAAQANAGTWIGSSVIHLGDRAVPNALFFLDKYLQVPNIITPVYIVMSNIDKLYRNPYLRDWINAQYSSVEDLKLSVLADFFRHAFDGSGADNFYDAGSCIDGRLTSTWNWANGIEKKAYYNVFLLCGFTSFNGEGY